MGRKNQHLAVL